MVEEIPILALTGGPCGGKTSAIAYLQEHLSDMGFAVIVVPEAATQFMLAGIKPDMFSEVEFQRLLAEHIIHLENHWKRAALAMRAEKKVIICDRGVVDAAAYVSPAAFNEMLCQLETNVVALRDARYEAVFFLTSVATDKPELYTRANNAARRETRDEAREIDRRTLAAWIGQPHLRVIDNSTDFDGKLARLLKEVCHVLGIPVPLEIERKYLVHKWNPADLPALTQAVDITQYYLIGGGRIRSRGQYDAYIYDHTLKEEIRPGVRVERRRSISRDEFDVALLNRDTSCGPIVKKRHCFLWRSQYFELDVFARPEGLVLLELESTEENDRVELPDFLAGNVTDVTDDPAYYNYEIARRLAT